MFPKMVTRPDLKIFLPPIGGITTAFDAAFLIWE